MSSPEPAPTPWRNRNFRIVWAGGLVNDTGDWLLRVALPVFVFTETGSGTSTAIVFVVELVAALVMGPLGGAFVDHHDLRRVIVGTNLLQAVVLLPLLAVTADRVWPAYLVAAVQAGLVYVNDPAKVALLPRLVPPEQLTVANAANSTSASLARLVGSPLGGLAVAAGGLLPVVIIDGITFLTVAAATSFVRADTAPVATADGGASTRLGEIRAGWRALREVPILRGMLDIHAITQVAQGFFLVLFVVFVVESLGGDGGAVGIIRGTMAVGALAGAFVVSRFGSGVQPLRLFALGLVGMGGAALVFWNAAEVTTELWVFVILFSLSGLPGAALLVGFLTSIQQAAPVGYVGRVMGAFTVADALGVAVGSIAAGLLVDRVSLPALLNGQAVIYLVGGLLAFSLLRRVGPGTPSEPPGPSTR